MAADDARPFDQAALPAVTVADHDLRRAAGEAQAVGRKRLDPDRARHVAAVLLPHEERAAARIAHDARVDRRARLADQWADVRVGPVRVAGHADGHARPSGLLAGAVVDEVAVAVALQPRAPDPAAAAPGGRRDVQ